MSKHVFTIVVDVDDAALAERNRLAEQYGDRTLYPYDASEWGDSDLLIALDEEVATLEITDYRAVNDSASEAYEADRAARAITARRDAR